METGFKIYQTRYGRTVVYDNKRSQVLRDENGMIIDRYPKGIVVMNYLHDGYTDKIIPGKLTTDFKSEEEVIAYLNMNI